MLWLIAATAAAELPFPHPMRALLDAETSRLVYNALKASSAEIIEADPKAGLLEETKKVEGLFCRHSHWVDPSTRAPSDKYLCELSGAGNGEPGVLVEPTSDLVYYRLVASETSSGLPPSSGGEYVSKKVLGSLSCEFHATYAENHRVNGSPWIVCRVTPSP
jgi:hypothetical protein